MRELKDNKIFIKKQKNIVKNILNCSDIENFEADTKTYASDLINSWQKNKARVYKSFGNRMCLVSEPFKTGEFLSDEEEAEVLKDFVKEFLIIIHNLKKDYNLKITEDNSFEESINGGSYIIHAYNLCKALNPILKLGDDEYRFLSTRNLIDSMIRNTLTENLKDIKANYNKGMKFSKFLNKLLTAKYNYDKDLNTEEYSAIKSTVSKLVIEYSKVRQKVAGNTVRAYVSIIPGDYVTVSDNNENWTSCHSMAEGSYSIGNFNYMTDNCTFVAYVLSDKDKFNQKINDFYGDVEWNSKKWRALGHLVYDNNNNVKGYFIDKNYPYFSNEFLSKVDKLLCQALKFNNNNSLFSNLEIYNKKHKRTTCVPIGHRDDTLGYLDLSRASDTYVNVRVLKREFDDKELGEKEVYKAIIGGAVPCVACGKGIAVTEEGFCHECEDKLVYCAECGEQINLNYDNFYMDSDGNYYCDDCGQECLFYCDYCGEYHQESKVDRFSTNEYLDVCQTAIDNGDYAFCESCNTLFNSDDLIYVDGEGYFCSECIKDREVEKEEEV